MRARVRACVYVYGGGGVGGWVGGWVGACVFVRETWYMEKMYENIMIY